MKGALLFAILAAAFFFGANHFAAGTFETLAIKAADLEGEIAIHNKITDTYALTPYGVRGATVAAAVCVILALVSLLLADWKSKLDSKPEFKEAR